MMDTGEIILLCLFVVPILLYSIYTFFSCMVGLPKELREAASTVSKYEKKIKDLEERESRLAEQEQETLKKEEFLKDVEGHTERVLARVDTYLERKCESFPYLAGMMADFLTLHYDKSARYLEAKNRPAFVEASRIQDLKKETREIIKEKKVLEYKLAYIEKLFPNINDVFDSEFVEERFELETEDNTDRTRLFLSAEEYQTLSAVEKNQLALDRYVENRKSKWQIGRDYEMYIGHQIEKKGYTVQYTGIIQKLEDMGRDLIAQKGKDCYIVQCKNWSQEKTIHEKHVFQLYGTVVLYRIDHPHINVQGVFVASTELSPKAKAVAKALGITTLENISLKDFPRIKCNVSRATGEKIYHLPFDQQYDTTMIEARAGEFFALTVAEAEEKGFRRAWKHFA